MHPHTYSLKLVTFVVAISVFFLFPVLIFISIPLFIFRYFVSKIAPRIKPNLGKMLTTRSTYLAIDDFLNYPKNNILVGITFESNLDINHLKKLIISGAVTSKLPSGELRYPEIRQYVTTYAGYFFWKEDEKFDIDSHVRLYDKCKSDKDEFTDADMMELREELLNKKWMKNKPLWELILVQNYYPRAAENNGPHFLLILRCHHCLGDGYSILSLIINCLSENKVEDFRNAHPEKIQKPILEKIWYTLTAPVALSKLLAENIVARNVTYPWKVPLHQQKQLKCHIDLTDKIPLSRIKEIKNHFNVSFSSVIFAVIAGAQREILLKKNIPVPKIIPALSPFPMPGHPIKLRNYMSAVYINLPIGEPDPIQRLMLSSKDYQSLKKSHSPLLAKFLMPLFGSYFTCITKHLASNQAVTTGMSNFPAGKTPLYLEGKQPIDIMFAAQLLEGCAGLAICIISYMDGLRFSSIAHADILTKDELREMTLSIHEQIDILYKELV